MRRAREVILLADSTKMGTRSFVSAGPLDRVHTIVTDAGIDERLVRSLTRRGIRVIAA
jgi:DeoR/GlpR family transcriptional regulator of sugar metabolism